jgi:hypothetical protein
MAAPSSGRGAGMVVLGLAWAAHNAGLAWAAHNAVGRAHVARRGPTLAVDRVAVPNAGGDQRATRVCLTHTRESTGLGPAGLDHGLKLRSSARSRFGGIRLGG